MSARRSAVLSLLAALASIATAPSSSAQTACTRQPNAGALEVGLLGPRAYLRIKAGSEDHVWGHPALLALVRGGARAVAAAVPGSVTLIGDLSALEGGPLAGHVSHQSGLDADVALFVSDSRGQPVVLDRFEAFDIDGRSLANPDHVLDVYRNWVMLRHWLRDLRVVVTHLFISAELRDLLLAYGRQSPEFARYAPLAERLMHAHPTHADHFHLRIACPDPSVH